MQLCNLSLKNLVHRRLYGVCQLLNQVSIVICTTAFTIFIMRALSGHSVHWMCCFLCKKDCECPWLPWHDTKEKKKETLRGNCTSCVRSIHCCKVSILEIVSRLHLQLIWLLSCFVLEFSFLRGAVILHSVQRLWSWRLSCGAYEREERPCILIPAEK